MERRKGIMFECVNQDIDTRAKMIASNGFTNTFSGSYDIGEVEKIKSACDKNGIEVEFLHAPFDGINNMWLGEEESKSILPRIMQSIDCASAHGIKTIILHASSQWKPPAITDHGTARYDALVEYADKKGVCVAIENLRRYGYFGYLIDRYEDAKNVTYCYDNGHSHCYTDIPVLDVFGKKLSCTHIHDNMGRSKFDRNYNGDMHLLPFDGNFDFQKMMDKLDELGYEGSLMLEVWKKKEYQNMTDEEFVAEAYKRAVKLDKLSK